MKSYPNIEKSAFRKGEYVGYCEGRIYHIKRSKNTFWTWAAYDCENSSDQIVSFNLAEMSKKLTAKQGATA